MCFILVVQDHTGVTLAQLNKKKKKKQASKKQDAYHTNTAVILNYAAGALNCLIWNTALEKKKKKKEKKKTIRLYFKFYR